MKHIPGFGAESSLGPAMGMYMEKSAHFWTNRGFATGIVSITPQQSSLLATIIGSDCFGSVDQCLDRFCVNLPPGKQRAEWKKCSPTISLRSSGCGRSFQSHKRWNGQKLNK